MASFSVDRSKHATLTADAVDTVTLGYRGTVEVLNRSASDYIYFTNDDSAPAVDGDDTFVVGPGQSLLVGASNVGSNEVVKLISAGAAAYSVTGF